MLPPLMLLTHKVEMCLRHNLPGKGNVFTLGQNVGQNQGASAAPSLFLVDLICKGSTWRLLPDSGLIQ